MTATSLDAGTYYMYASITGSKNYNDIVTQTIEFTVKPGDMVVSISSENGATEEVENGIIVGFSKLYNGTKLPLYITADINNYTLKYGTVEGDYSSTLDLTTNILGEIGSITNVGSETYYYQITANNYNTITGSVTLQITIKEVEVIWEGVTAAYEYNGADQGSSIKAYINGYKNDGTIEKQYCAVTFTGQGATFKDAGTYTAHATLANSNYTLIDHTYEGLVITPYATTISAQDVTMAYGDIAPSYTHTATPTPFDSYEMSYTITDSDSVDVTSTISSQSVGTYTITANSNLSTNNYTITYNNATLTINPCDLSTVVVEIKPIADQTYTGNIIEPIPEITVQLGSGRTEKLVDFTDFVCVYTGNKEVGVATITINGKGNYSGTLTDAVSFNIVAKGIVKPTEVTETYISTAC